MLDELPKAFTGAMPSDFAYVEKTIDGVLVHPSLGGPPPWKFHVKQVFGWDQLWLQPYRNRFIDEMIALVNRVAVLCNDSRIVSDRGAFDLRPEETIFDGGQE